MVPKSSSWIPEQMVIFRNEVKLKKIKISHSEVKLKEMKIFHDEEKLNKIKFSTVKWNSSKWRFSTVNWNWSKWRFWQWTQEWITERGILVRAVSLLYNLWSSYINTFYLSTWIDSSLHSESNKVLRKIFTYLSFQHKLFGDMYTIINGSRSRRVLWNWNFRFRPSTESG